MSQACTNAINTLNQTKDSLIKLLNATPEDKLNWSPSESARTPVELGVHSAIVVKSLHGALAGGPFEFNSTGELDARLRASEKQVHSKEKAIEDLEQSCRDYEAWLASLPEEKLSTNWESPFGAIPMPVAIGLPAGHMEGHVHQLEYIQTIYGDRVWH